MSFDELAALDAAHVMQTYARLPVAFVRGDGTSLARALSRADGVRGAVAPTGAAWRRGDTAIVNVFPAKEDSASTVSAR